MNDKSNETKPRRLARVFFVLRFLEIRLRFILILVLTALLVGYWDFIQNYYERWQRQHTAQSDQDGHASSETEGQYEYYCGMHPFVVRNQPGKCPICGMDLTQRRKGAPAVLPEGALARVQASPERIMQAGVHIDPVLYRLLSRTVRSYGVIEAAETLVQNVTARFPGRVDDLLVNATGVQVKKGEPLARIYSPEFLSGGQEYVRALAGQRRVLQDPTIKDEEKERIANLVASARRRLSLAGFTDEQLDSLAASGDKADTVTLYSPTPGTVIQKNVVQGQMVETGTAIYVVADLSTLWIQVLVMESDLSAVHMGMPVEVSTVAWPGEIFYGTVELIYPEVNPDNRSVKVRVSVVNAEGKLRPGMYVSAVMRSLVGRQTALEGATPATTGAESAASAGEKSHGSLPTRSAQDAQAFLDTLPEGGVYYVCTMHPQVVSDRTGECPLCGMTLVERRRDAANAAPSAAPPAIPLPTTSAADADQFLASLPVQGEYYVCPMHPEVVSNKAEECPKCHMLLEHKTKEAGAATEAVLLAEDGSYQEWTEGYACPMHPNELSDKPGVCVTCGCGMKTTKWRMERVLSVPESAVIDTGTMKVVYVESAPGIYDAHEISVGARTGAYYPVLQGLTLGQRVVTRGSFLIDAEARLNPAATGTAQTGN